MLRLKGNVKFIILVSESRILEIIGVSKREALLGSLPPTMWIFFFLCVCSIKYEKGAEGCCRIYVHHIHYVRLYGHHHY